MIVARIDFDEDHNAGAAKWRAWAFDLLRKQNPTLSGREVITLYDEKMDEFAARLDALAFNNRCGIPENAPLPLEWT